MMSRSSSGSSREESVAEQHSGKMAALGVLLTRRFGHGFVGELGDRAQHLLAMPERDTDFFEVLVCEVAENAPINVVVGEALSVLSQAE